MTTVTTEALLLAKYNEYKPSADEITAWNTVTKHASAVATVTIKAGLFGADLTKFNEECAELDWCDVTDYETFSGWAVGVAWTGLASNAVVTPLGVAFNGLGTLVQNTFSAAAASSVKDVKLTADVTASTPAVNTLTPANSVNPLTGWSGKSAVSVAIGEQTAFYFQDSEDDFYLEAEDTDDVWATGDLLSGTQTNVNTPDFEFVGAASLVAASASIIVASLLF
jgi:hypothetical protein